MRWIYLAIFLSVTLHVLLLYLLSGRLWVIAPPPELIEVEYKEKPPAGDPEAHSRARAPSPRARNPRGRKRGPLTLRSLSPKFDMKGAIAAGQAAQFDTDARGSSEWSNEHWGARGGSLKEMEHYISYYLLQREIQGALSYPMAMGVRSIDGTISARMTFTKDSTCDRKRTWARGHHHYLRFYILALMRKICTLSNIEQMHFKEGQFVDLTFAFVIQEGRDREVLEGRDNITGNVMRFERIYPKAWYEWSAGPFRGIYGVPFVFLDYPWVLDSWEKWVEGRDPLDAFR